MKYCIDLTSNIDRIQTALNRRSQQAIVVAFVLLISACAENVDPVESLRQGKILLDNGELTAAVIELKNAVQGAPDNAEARFYLGAGYQAAGNFPSALKEFRRARSFGMISDELDLGITRSLIHSGALTEAASELATRSDDSNSEWVVLQSLLDLGAGRFDEAKTGFAMALQLDPDHLEARRGAIRAALALGESAGAREAVAEALKLTQDDFDIWLLKGDIDRHAKAYEDAEAAYTIALDLVPRSPVALLQRAAVRAARLDNEGALTDLDLIGKASNEDPRALYLRALIAKQQENPNLALRYIREVLQVIPKHRDSLAQAAVLHFGLNELRDAESYLERLLEIDPDNQKYRNMMRSVQLASGNLETDFGDMKNVDIETVSDPKLLVLLGTAYLKNGNLSDGTRSLERASELAPDSIAIRTELAFSMMRAGNIEKAMIELAAVREADPQFVTAGVLQAFGYATQSNSESALTVADDLIEKNPEVAVVYNVRGYLNGLFKQHDKATADFDKALSLNPEFHPARFNLARLAVGAGDNARAQKILRDVLERTPNHPQALLTLANMEIQDGKEDAAVRLWEQARDANAESAEPRILLARHYRELRNVGLATKLATEAYKLAPHVPAAQQEFAIMKLYAGEAEAALPAIKDLLRRYPEAEGPQQLLARAYAGLGDIDALQETLAAHVDSNPESIRQRIALARIHIQRDEFDQAQEHAQHLKANDKSAADGYLLEGDIAYRKGAKAQAKTAYQHAHELRPNSETLLRVYGASDDGDRVLLLDEWLASHPDDDPVRITKASTDVALGELDAAIDHYEKVLARSPNNVLALNNLAWIYDERGDESAIDYAQRAYEAAPDRAEIADTYGWIMLRQGNVEQAITLIRKALRLAPENRDIRYHFADALSRRGDERGAITELEQLLGDDSVFTSRGGAVELLAKLRKQRDDDS